MGAGAGGGGPYLNEPMYIPRMLRIHRLAGIVVLLCLASICWCVRVIRKRQGDTDRFLLGIVGFIAISHGLHMLKDIGIWTASELFHRLEDFVNVTKAGLCLIGALLLETWNRDRISAQLSLWLVQANGE